MHHNILEMLLQFVVTSPDDALESRGSHVHTNIDRHYGVYSLVFGTVPDTLTKYPHCWEWIGSAGIII